MLKVISSYLTNLGELLVDIPGIQILKDFEGEIIRNLRSASVTQGFVIQWQQFFN